MSHLESLIAEYLEFKGYLVKRNSKVGRLAHGGYEMELDIIAYNPMTKDLIHCEPSIDALSWNKRETRYRKKFEAGRKYIKKEIFPWLDRNAMPRQWAVFITHPEGRDRIAGGSIISIDELLAEIGKTVRKQGIVGKNAIPENYPLLRTLQLSVSGYYGIRNESNRRLILC